MFKTLIRAGLHFLVLLSTKEMFSSIMCVCVCVSLGLVYKNHDKNVPSSAPYKQRISHPTYSVKPLKTTKHTTVLLEVLRMWAEQASGTKQSVVCRVSSADPRPCCGPALLGRRVRDNSLQPKKPQGCDGTPARVSLLPPSSTKRRWGAQPPQSRSEI